MKKTLNFLAISIVFFGFGVFAGVWKITHIKLNQPADTSNNWHYKQLVIPKGTKITNVQTEYFGPERCFRYNASFTTKEGCKESVIASCTTRNGAPDYDDIHSLIADWIKPQHLKHLEITLLKEVTKDSLFKGESERFIPCKP